MPFSSVSLLTDKELFMTIVKSLNPPSIDDLLELSTNDWGRLLFHPLMFHSAPRQPTECCHFLVLKAWSWHQSSSGIAWSQSGCKGQTCQSREGRYGRTVASLKNMNLEQSYENYQAMLYLYAIMINSNNTRTKQQQPAVNSAQTQSGRGGGRGRG